jgi:KDO2-lipid IV(A) lauroyltransferase
MAVVSRIPYRWAGAWGQAFGAVVFNLSTRERKKTLRNIRIAMPKATEEEAHKLALSVWTKLGRNLFELIRWIHMTREQIVGKVARVRGWEHMEKALAAKKGVLVLTGHLGNWELLGGYVASRMPTTAVAQNLYDPRFDELITWMRTEKLRVPMIKRGMALRGILEALKKNWIVYALVDQDTGNDGVFVPFFGIQAWTQSGMARIAARTGAALVPAFLVRGADDQFELHVERAIEVAPTGNPEKDVLEMVRRYTESVESYVKAYPDQWMWMHERWKTRPPGESK